MKRSGIILGLTIALLTGYVQANEKKNQKSFFESFWKSENAAPAAGSELKAVTTAAPSDDIVFDNVEGSGSLGVMKENTRGDDEDYDSIDEPSGDGPIKQNFNLYDDDEDDDEITIKGEDDELDGSGSGETPIVEEKIVDVNVENVNAANIPTGTDSSMTRCQSLMHNSPPETEYIPSCDKSGAYNKLQCFRDKSQCWCVNSDGRRIPGTNMTAPSVPDCEFGENLKTCVFQLVQHSQGLLGAYKPSCTIDGLYEPIQCQGSECWCVDKMGNEIIGSIRNKPALPQCYDFESTTTKKVNIVVPDDKGGYDIGPDTEPDNAIDVVVANPIDLDNEDMEEEEEKTNNRNDATIQGTHTLTSKETTFLAQPGLLAAIIGATVVGLLCIVLLVMFLVYRMRKKDEGSYPLEEQKYPNYQYTKAPEKEFYA